MTVVYLYRCKFTSNQRQHPVILILCTSPCVEMDQELCTAFYEIVLAPQPLNTAVVFLSWPRTPLYVMPNCLPSSSNNFPGEKKSCVLFFADIFAR